MADEEKDNNITLKFIEDYRSLPVLWDPSNEFYTKKIKRNEGLQFLATRYNMDIDGVKKKIKSLRSYFSKEHHKVMKKNEQSPWFAYKHLLFTADAIPCESYRDTSSSGEVKDEQAEISYNTISISSVQGSFMSEDEHEFALPPVRKKRHIKNEKMDSTEEEGHQQYIEKPCEELSNGQKDEFTIYGQLIAHKIRKLNSYNRLIAQQRINSVLFDLEMEQIDYALK